MKILLPILHMVNAALITMLITTKHDEFAMAKAVLFGLCVIGIGFFFGIIYQQNKDNEE